MQNVSAIFDPLLPDLIILNGKILTFDRNFSIAQAVAVKNGLNVQSPIKWTIAAFMSTVVGPERSAYQWPLGTMLDNGIRVANSSDAPAIYPDRKQGVQSAVLRESKAHCNYFSIQSLNIRQ